jgi:putative tricarboxylic transport membrane protein
VWDIVVMLGFGGLGYLMRKFEYEPAPMVLAFVLGRMTEESIRQSLLISRGSFEILFTRPIATTFLAVTLAVMVAPLVVSPVKRLLRTVPLEEVE